jgi:hypothetical protein
LHDLQTEASHLVASLRANSGVPGSIVPNIVTSVNTMIGSAVSGISSDTVNILVECGVSQAIVQHVQTALSRSVETLNRPLEFLSTKHMEDKHFHSHPLAVNPETIILGHRYETRNAVSNLVYDSYQYVSVESTLRSLLTNKRYVEMLLSDDYCCDMTKDCRDGKLFANHPLLMYITKFTIALELFFDGMGSTNPLREQSTMYNLGVFYYVLKNLPSVFNSCFANVHLLALCYSPDLKAYGFEPVLEKFVAEMKRLSVDGFIGNFPILGNRKIFVTMLHVACDNLALNGMLGFIESFSADFFCTMCYAKQEEIQCKFKESEFELRTLDKYLVDVANLRNLRTTGKQHCRGVKKPCILNDIPGYHVTSNYSIDIMHTVLEGIVPVELSCVLYALCHDSAKSRSLEHLSERVRVFWGVIDVDRCN